MGEHSKRIWTVGGLSRGAGGVEVSEAVDLTRQRFDELVEEIGFVRGLADNPDLRRLVVAVQRYDATIARATAELRDGTVSAVTAAAVGLDLRAATLASDRLERALLEKIENAPPSSADATQAFEETRHRMRASPPYLVAHELARRSANDGVQLLVDGNAVRFDGAASQEARDVVTALLGFLLGLSDLCLQAFRPRFEEVAGGLDELAVKVVTGSPSLISYELDAATGEPQRLTITELPLREIYGLRQYYEQRHVAQTYEDLAGAAVALSRGNDVAHVRVGDVDLTSGHVGGGASTSANDLPAARFELDLDLLGSAVVDYWGPVYYAMERDGDETELFTGAVQDVALKGNSASLECEGAVDLVEHNTGGIAAAGIAPAELIQSLILQAGLPPGVIPAAKQQEPPPTEAFEVLIPIRGIQVTKAVPLGAAWIVPAARGREAVAALGVEGEVAERLVADFNDAASYGLVETESRWLHEAEDEGVAAIEVAVAWLAVRGRYGLARLPDRRGRPFSRQQGLRAAAAGQTVLVRGKSKRRWLRWRGPGEPLPRPLDTKSPDLEPPLPRALEARERQALLALQRAATGTVVESQLQALWEAIELYTAEMAPPKLFSKAKLNELRAALGGVEELNEEQGAAVERALAGLNQRASADLLSLQLGEDGVPLSDSERAVVDKLRAARNDVVHGRAMQDPPTREELQRGISLVARMLVYRVDAIPGNADSVISGDSSRPLPPL